MTDDPGTMKADVVPRLGDPPILFLAIDGVMLRRRHSGTFDGFEIAPHCLEFIEWATLRFGAAGCPHAASGDFSTGHTGRSAKPGAPFLIRDGTYST